MRRWRILLAIIAVVSFGIALYYPITYRMAEESNNSSMEELSAMRHRVMDAENLASEGVPTATDSVGTVPEATEPSGAADAPEATAVTNQTEAPAEPTIVPEGTAIALSAPTDAPETPGATVGAPVVTEVPGATVGVPVITEVPAPTPTLAPGETAASMPVSTATLPPEAFILFGVPGMTPPPTPTPRPTLTPSPEPSPTPNRRVYQSEVLPYPLKEKVEFDESRILPELKEIYELNHDLVGWITIPGTNVDYPVVQSDDMDFYLHHDFYGADNNNGQIILDTLCDPYTPSYNLIISGHHMNNGSMFGRLPDYKDESYWKDRKFVEFDTLMARGRYVIFAAFYSADYDEDEEGFRYNADICYRMEAEKWLEEVRENQLYDTGIDAEFGDEFVTLTTCNRSRRKDGRFVVVCRKVREGEEFDE